MYKICKAQKSLAARQKAPAIFVHHHRVNYVILGVPEILRIYQIYANPDLVILLQVGFLVGAKVDPS